MPNLVLQKVPLLIYLIWPTISTRQLVAIIIPILKLIHLHRRRHQMKKHRQCRIVYIGYTVIVTTHSARNNV